MLYSNEKDINILFTDEVLDLFEKHRQATVKDLEAGGQLFGRLIDNQVVVLKATGLRLGDKRWRYAFWPNRELEKKEIKNLYKDDLHYIGDWHTHPEKRPTPSDIDIKNIRECFAQSKHDLKYFIMVIVGTLPFPEGIYISVQNQEESIILNLV